MKDKASLGKFQSLLRCEIGHKPGETDPQCSHSELQEMSSIEIAHTFQLGTRYAQVFKAFVPGTQRPLEMGCYGIGVSRSVYFIL